MLRFIQNWSSFHNMLNIPNQSFPAPSSQQRVSPSAQSGRNKVSLKPGHSLMDWIRFAKSGKDLTGLRGRLMEVTQDELQKHNKREDCWTCIRGMVYNVTPYMDYHPGGEEELMKAAGIDGTDLFDQVHRWVNYESMLKECLVGRMTTKSATASKAIILPSSPTGLAPPAAGPPPPNKDSQPRYDWFQTDATVHLAVYTKRKISSSGCVTVDLKAGILRLEVLFGKLSYMIHLDLAHEVEENVSVHTAFSVGKIQVTINKQTRGKWTSLGQPLEFHNTFLCKKNRGTEIVRPYTPVDQNMVPVSSSSSHESYLYLMIKVYPDGVFTPYLNSLQMGENISVSGPEGTFSLRPLRDVTHLYLLAGGTGFTPMVRLISLALREVDTIRWEQSVYSFTTSENMTDG
ncbi:cytochrome b5 reductase 4 isoform X3 [Poecilia latipinna]|uniref:cytochrome b5 reductase 4 isoform X3 n=1 Tax=Poecilia latipinna TaxID=48699 RepID=UPI00072EED82|nr:PREDICTED: cytochrome b5 reductase 4 isoform X3 [Poecilia latipinna]